MDLKVLPQDQIDYIVMVMDYVLKHNGGERDKKAKILQVTVGDIKSQFGLNEQQYQMIYDLCMPVFRKKSYASNDIWRTAYLALKQRLYRSLRDDESITAQKVLTILQQDHVNLPEGDKG